MTNTADLAVNYRAVQAAFDALGDMPVNHIRVQIDKLRAEARRAWLSALAPGDRVFKVGGNGGNGTIATAPTGVGSNHGCMVTMDEGGSRWWPMFVLVPEKPEAEIARSAMRDGKPSAV